MWQILQSNFTDMDTILGLGDNARNSGLNSDFSVPGMGRDEDFSVPFKVI
jgi:hypothetical protein